MMLRNSLKNGGGGLTSHSLIPIEEILYKGIIEHTGNRCVVCGYEEFFDDVDVDNLENVRPDCV